MSKLLRRLVEGRLAGSIVQLPDDPTAAERWPDLWTWLTSTDAGAEHTKEPARLTIVLGLGEWSVSLTDESLGVSLSTTALTLEGSFGAIQMALMSPNPSIRTWKGSEGSLKKRKKKNGGEST